LIGNAAFELAMFNLKLDNSLDEVEAALIADDLQKGKDTIGLKSEKEHPMCVVIELSF
jgi:hypothetical protein